MDVGGRVRHRRHRAGVAALLRCALGPDRLPHLPSPSTCISPPAIAFVVPAVGLVPTTYNLLLVNYTTAPGLALVLATAAGHAAAVRGSRPWAATAGAAAVLAGFSHPAMVPSAVGFLLVLIVLCRADGRWRWVVGGATSAGVIAAVWLLAVVGTQHIAETLAYTVDYQSTRLTRGQRLDALWRVTSLGWRRATYLPMWGLALIASLRPIGHRVRAALLLGVVVAAAVPSILLVMTTDPVPTPFGRFSGVYAAVVSCGLLVPAVLAVSRERDRRMTVLMMLALPPAFLSVPVVAALSSAGPYWGGCHRPCSCVRSPLGGPGLARHQKLLSTVGHHRPDRCGGACARGGDGSDLGVLSGPGSLAADRGGAPGSVRRRAGTAGSRSRGRALTTRGPAVDDGRAQRVRVRKPCGLPVRAGSDQHQHRLDAVVRPSQSVHHRLLCPTRRLSRRRLPVGRTPHRGRRRGFMA